MSITIAIEQCDEPLVVDRFNSSHIAYTDRSLGRMALWSCNLTIKERKVHGGVGSGDRDKHVRRGQTWDLILTP